MIVDRNDIYGNGVNVAARLESLAEPGVICISRKVLDEVRGKVDIGFEDLGLQEVKNIAEPVQTYRVILDNAVVATSTPPLPAKPSIAVLPFDILGGDPRTSDLVDGLTEDLITALAKVRDLIVIDRRSSEIYKDRSLNLREVAKALGVKYVLTGSIRTAGERLRCSAQLVDSLNGQHLWAERYDRTVNDIFALQDEIVWQILLELQVNLTEGEGARIASRGTSNLEAWLLRVQGAAEMGKFTREGHVRARELFEAAHRADPNWARPLAAIAYNHYHEARFGWSASTEESIARGVEFAERAIALNPNEPFAYGALRGLSLLRGDYDKALAWISANGETGMTQTWFDSLDDVHMKFIADQHMFFVATAAPEGRVNMAPKDGPSLKVMGPNRIIWVNLTGAENETGAHWAESKRMTLMWCSFTKTPIILRVYGQADLIHPRDASWNDLIAHFPPRIGSRQILDVNIDFVLKSCGFGVPLYDFVEHRDTLRRWEERKGLEGVRQHWKEKNQTSIDGKPTRLLPDPS